MHRAFPEPLPEGNCIAMLEDHITNAHLVAAQAGEYAAAPAVCCTGALVRRA